MKHQWPPDVEERLSKPNTLAGRMQRAVLDCLIAHNETGALPTSGRFLFYELEGKGIVRKSKQGESRRGGASDPREQEVIDALTDLRDRGVIPWSWIEDETRSLVEWDYASTVAEYLQDRLEWARINPWPADPPLILVESRSLGGVLRNIAARYVCPIAATNGQVGGFLHTDIVPILDDNERPVLYLGDWDHQGHQIEANTRNVLEQETGRSIDWERLAITAGQIEARGLTPIHKTDSRFKPPRTHPAWETEALGQSTITQLVREALDSRLPEPLDDVLEREDAQRDEIRETLAG